MVSLFSIQFVWAGPVGFGIRGGVVMANQVSSLYSETPSYNSDVLFGFTGGIFAEVGLLDFLSIQPEVDYTMKGVQVNANFNSVDSSGNIIATNKGTLSYSFDYVEVPLLLKAHTTLSPHLTGSLSVGPEAGFLLSADYHYAWTGANNATGDFPLNGVGVDWGLLFGAGLELDSFLLDLRYDLGLTSVFQNFPTGPENSVLSLQVGYRIQ